MDGDDIGVSLELVSAGDIHRKGEVGEVRTLTSENKRVSPPLRILLFRFYCFAFRVCLSFFLSKTFAALSVGTQTDACARPFLLLARLTGILAAIARRIDAEELRWDCRG